MHLRFTDKLATKSSATVGTANGSCGSQQRYQGCEYRNGRQNADTGERVIGNAEAGDKAIRTNHATFVTRRSRGQNSDADDSVEKMARLDDAARLGTLRGGIRLF